MSGFVSAATLAREAAQVSEAEFVRRHPSPGLLLLAVDFEENLATEVVADDRTARRTTVKETAHLQSGIWEIHDRVAFIEKRPGNPFPTMFSVGRAATNDLVFPLETVSTLHGYFVRDGSSWSFSDHKSTNGTFLNGARLSSTEKHALAGGDRLHIGLELAAIFLPPASLYASLRRT